jgi:hypothetical protein
VLGYDKRQVEVLQQLLGRVSTVRLGLLFLAAAALSVLPYLLVRLINRRRERPDARDALIQRFCARMARAGLPRRTGEGIRDYAARIAAERPDLGDEAQGIAEAFVSQRYDPATPLTIEQLRERVRRLRAPGKLVSSR